jgi:Chitobiase/beta-hexosaminidase C-terminal domain/Right handed beta helix region
MKITQTFTAILRAALLLAACAVVVSNSPGAVALNPVTATLTADKPTLGTTYYVDPIAGSMNYPGTAAAPWSTLQEVFAARKTFVAGDVIYLRSGNHGFPVITGDNTGDVTIIKQAGHEPVINRIDFIGATHWVLDGVEVHTTAAPPAAHPLTHPVFPVYENTLVRITSASSEITLRDCSIYSIGNSSGWTADDWNTRAWNGVYINNNSHHVTIDKCHVKNFFFGINMNNTTHHLTIKNSIVRNFCGDALRASCDDLIIENNVIRDVYETNGNHYDMIQGFASARVVIRNNVILSATSSRPLIHEAQGIGAFDGWFDDWIVENNLVATGHWNSISLLGARNCRVVNNTVAHNPLGIGTMRPWIQIAAHKDGTPSTGNVVRNNITPWLNTEASVGAVDFNVVSSDYASLFVNYQRLNFHLRLRGAAVAAGTPDLAPPTDIEGNPRTLPIDAGAYDFERDPNTVVAPVFSHSPGEYFGAQNISITSATDGATIRYTTDGRPPKSRAGITYTGPVAIGANATLKAVAIKDGMRDSFVRSGDYVINTNATVTPAMGFYASPLPSAQSGEFTAQFDVTPSISPIDALIGFSLGSPTAYSGIAAIVRFNNAGVIDAYNGSGYSAVTNISYAAGETYHFRMVINVPAHTYSVFVTSPGGNELLVGENFGFRSPQASVTGLDHVVGSVVATPGGSIFVDNFAIDSGLTAPVITQQPASTSVK